jgi:hypothetical protein
MPTHPQATKFINILREFQVIRTPSRASSLTGNFDWFSKRTYRLISIPNIQYNSFLHAGLMPNLHGTPFPQLTNVILTQHANTVSGLPSCGSPTMLPTIKVCKKLFWRESELGEVKLRLASSDRVFYSFALILVLATRHDQVLAAF